MSHFTRTHADGTWLGPNYVTVASDYQSLSDKIYKSINGDQGGCWAPSSPIDIDTGGMLVTAASTVDYGGSLTTISNARFTLDGTEHPRLGVHHVGRLWSVRTPLVRRQSYPHGHWTTSMVYPGSIQSLACTIQSPTALEQPSFFVSMRVRDGARMPSATLTYRIPTARSAAPIAMPKVRIIRSDKDGVLTTLKSVASGADSLGYVSFPTITSGAAWYANGAAQTFTYTCDQNNVIDTSQYTYYFQLIEEIGTRIRITSPSSFDGSVVRERKNDFVKSFFLNQAPTGAAAGVVTGNRVLLANNTNKGQNGLWVVNAAGAWVRPTDFAGDGATTATTRNAPNDFTPGFLINETPHGWIWELVYPVLTDAKAIAGESTLSVGQDILFQRRDGRGNIYHSLVGNFDQITDMRPQ